VRPDGIIFCEGFVREGTNEGWTGLHQHDLVPEDGQLVEYTRGGRRKAVSEGLGLACLQPDVGPFIERSLTSHGHDWTPDGPGDMPHHPWYTLVWRRV
jgi:hypothetical protein